MGSAAGKRPEFVSVKRVQTPLQGVCTTIERTDESRRAHFPEANENKRGQMKVEVRGLLFTFAGVEMCSKPVLFLSRHKLIFERRSPMLQHNVEMI